MKEFTKGKDLDKDLKDAFYKKLKSDKIKINWNKNPIEMKTFLSFLNIDTEISKDHLGWDMGWTRRVNEEHKLIIGGGFVNQIEYLDSLQYGEHLDNSFNNYVNPFYCFDILNHDGKQLFLDYYNDEIKKIKDELTDRVERCENHLANAKQIRADVIQEVRRLTALNNAVKA